MTRYKIRYQSTHRQYEFIIVYNVFADSEEDAIQMCEWLNDDVSNILSCEKAPN